MSKVNLNLLVKDFLMHYNIMKMYHFQTKNYGAHKAVDVYITGFLVNFDSFMEVAQGRYGKLTNDKLSITFNTLKDSNADKHLNEYITMLNNMSKTMNVKELLAIRDVMVGDAQKLKYLLTFE